MKKLLTIPVALLLFLTSFSQPADLIINSGSKGQYLTHTVAPKEGLFPIGRLYNVHPRHIANFNGIDFNKGLAIGQQINVPLSDTNFKTAVNKGVPVYYKTTGSETIANISTKTKTPQAKLREWNSLANDNVPPGTKLIIGFLITNEMQNRVVTITPKVLDAESSVSNVKKSEAQKKQIESEPKKDAVSNTGAVSNKETNVKKEESKINGSSEKKNDATIVKEENKKTDPPVVREPETITGDEAGYFKNNFYQQVKASPLSKEQTVTSSIFKTMSGWQDGKYYLLMNGVEPGTIVKITNPTNSKIVFAKVLYAMDKIRENQGVDVRISDAAASSLAVTETDKFILKVSY